MAGGGMMHKIGGSGGPVEVDETFVGGDRRKMHKSRRLTLQRRRNEIPDWKVGEHYLGKTAVMGMLDRDARQVRAKVVPNVRRETLQNEILNQIDTGSTVYTDGAWAYDNLATREHTRRSTMLKNMYAVRYTRKASRISGRC
jgi:transposase-like protein